MTRVQYIMECLITVEKCELCESLLLIETYAKSTQHKFMLIGRKILYIAVLYVVKFSFFKMLMMLNVY